MATARDDLRPSRRRRSDTGGVTVAQRLVTALRERILTGDLEPGARVMIDDLCDRYNISHIPVREALRTLQAEGLLTQVPNHGTHVAELSPAEIDGLYDLRLMLEPALIARSCQNKSTADVVAAQEALEAMGALDPVANPVAFQNAHRQFHSSLILPATTPVSRHVLEPVWRHVQRYLVVMYQRPQVPSLGGVQHEEIFNAWRDGDQVCVERLQAHLEDGRVQLAATLSNA